MFKGGQIRGSAGCNSYSSIYQVSGDKIRVGEIALTGRACLDPQGVMKQENVFMGFLCNAQTFRLSDGRLQIFRSDGEAITFVPQEINWQNLQNSYPRREADGVLRNFAPSGTDFAKTWKFHLD